MEGDVRHIRLPAWVSRETVHSSSTAVMLLGILAVAVAFRGFIGLVPTPAGSLATWITDGVTVVCAVIVVWGLLGRRPLRDPWFVYAFGGFVAVSLFFCVISPEPWTVKLIALRNHALYGVVALYATQYLTEWGAARVEAVLRWAGVAVAVFGIGQYFFRASLPDWLLKPIDSDLFGYWGTDIVRANGLVGNTIVYAAFLLLILAVWWVRVFTTSGSQRWVALGATLVVGGAVLATFSRMVMLLAIVLMVVAPMLVALRRGRRAILLTGAVIGGGLVVAAVSVLLIEPLRARVLDSWIIRELFSQGNASVTESTDLHFEMIQMALDHFVGSPLVGIGYGTQSSGSTFSVDGSVITDGAHWATLAEGGALLTVATLGFFAIVLVRLGRVWWKTGDLEAAGRALAAGLYLVAQFGAASFLNSGFYGKTPFVAFWILAGCALAVGVSERRVEPASPR
jgi:hypothetical protein